MTNYEILTLAGLIVGPLSAVLITLWSQAKSGIRDRQLQTMRMLLNTRHMPADPAYTVAINMIPIEFNKQTAIMSAWHKYIATVHYVASEENKQRHQEEMKANQTKLVFEILRHLKYKLAETDIQTSAYAAQGFVDREALNTQAQVAWIRIANALEGQNAAAGLPEPTSPAELIPEQTSNPLPTGRQ
jgi:hypothetical protein